MGDAERASLLLYGYGNPGRGDDGLGPALVAALQALEHPPAVTIESNYQLEVEDSAELAKHKIVIFADADGSGPEPFWFDRVEPCANVGFSSHSISPQGLLALTDQLFGTRITAYALGIRGYEFGELKETLSTGAKGNLDQAFSFVRRALEDRAFDQYVQQYGVGRRPCGQTEGRVTEGYRQ